MHARVSHIRIPKAIEFDGRCGYTCGLCSKPLTLFLAELFFRKLLCVRLLLLSLRSIRTSHIRQMKITASGAHTQHKRVRASSNRAQCAEGADYRSLGLAIQPQEFSSTHRQTFFQGK